MPLNMAFATIVRPISDRMILEIHVASLYMSRAYVVRKRLQEVDEPRYFRFRSLESELHKLLEYSQAGNLRFTPHGISHVVAVERNYDWLLSEADVAVFNAAEMFCLLFATVLHDALMIPRQPGDEERARQEHTTRPLDYLLQHGQRLGISRHEAQAIAEIIRAHGIDDFSEIDARTVLGPESVDIRKLGACLSIADICHADESRAPHIVFDYLNFDSESAAHWRRHLSIGGITRRESNIEISSTVFSDEGLRAVEEYADAIRQQLQIVSPYFRSKLSTIDGVTVDAKRLTSPLQQEWAFRADPEAVLNMLISGVYEKDDVFVRELIQNSLDASYISAAAASKRSARYESIISLTVYKEGESDRIRAVRVDDNGCGMDATDIQDTILLIGGSGSSRKSVRDLLAATTQKSLIASFGIGLLSCLKVAERIVITTRKGSSSEGLRVEITGLAERIKTEAFDGFGEGTSVLVELAPDYRERTDYHVSARHYCRLVRQAQIFLLELPWSERTATFDLRTMLSMGPTQGKAIEMTEPKGRALTEISGEDFSGWIWGADVSQIDKPGTTTILNDGIYVTEEPSANWLTEKFSSCNALINFSAQAVDLAVSRDKVIQNDRYERKLREVSTRAYRIIRTLSGQTQDPKNRELPAATITHLFDETPEEEEPRLFAEMDEYHVALATGTTMPLREIKERKPEKVYVSYAAGSFVKDLTEIDGKQLYHKEDDIVDLQTSVLAQLGELVIRANRSRSSRADILEVRLIAAYLGRFGVQIVDLTKARPILGLLRSRPLPSQIRASIGKDVKFVDIEGLANKRAWRVGSEKWLNLAHPQVAACYEILNTAPADEETIFLANLYVAVLANEFSSAILQIATRLQERTP